MLMAEALDVARSVFPALPEDALGYIIWNETGFPGFWRIPEDGATPGECLAKQLLEYEARTRREQDE